MSHTHKAYPTDAGQYKLQEHIGKGVSAKVWRAICLKYNEEVAIKVINLERHELASLDEIRRETQTMSLLSHPNLVNAYCSFVTGEELWVVMPYLGGGSCLHLLKWANPQGFAEEWVIASILKGTLHALDYCHKNGLIHRDIKAGNILLGTDGEVKVADFGVSGSDWTSRDSKCPHKTFVGTPCWMAPEVVEQSHAYDYHADIWSVGITALELCHGHAPFARLPPMQVMLQTVQEPAPTLEDNRTRHFSRALREFVGACLKKEPSQRPSAAKLLEHKFFSLAKKREHVVKHLLDGQPTLVERTLILQEKEEQRRRDRGDSKGIPDREERSRSEYIRGVSAWNFDVQQLKLDAMAESIAEGGPSEESAARVVDTPYDPRAGDPSGRLSPIGNENGKKTRKGRFEVTEEPDDSASGPKLMRSGSLKLEGSVPITEKAQEQGAPATPRRPGEAAAGAPPAKEPTKKGRFSVIEDKEERPMSRSSSAIGDSRGVIKSGSVGSVPAMDRSTTLPPERSAAPSGQPPPGPLGASSTAAPGPAPGIERARSPPLEVIANASQAAANPVQAQMPQLLPQLQSLLCQASAQQEILQTLVKGLVKLDPTGDIGKDGQKMARSSSAIERSSSSASPPQPDELLNMVGELQNRIALLVEENQQLKKRNRNLERQLNAHSRMEAEEMDKKGDGGKHTSTRMSK